MVTFPFTDSGPHVYRFGSAQFDLNARTYIVGILNVTPDSFSDGGKFLDPGIAVDHALAMVRNGADIIDIGGESTRPKGEAYGEGAEEISAEEEIRRVVPVIERLAASTSAPLSVDTYKAAVADRALSAGASLVNDISGFRFDPLMASVVAEHGASAVLMHIKGTPKTMQSDPSYTDLFSEIVEYLRGSIAIAREHGVSQIIVDPGIGFGKSKNDNLRLISGLGRFGSLGYPVMVGPSRKSFIGKILDLPVEERLEGTISSVVTAILAGAQFVRVHDVREVNRAAVVADALKRADQVP